MDPISKLILLYLQNLTANNTASAKENKGGGIDQNIIPSRLFVLFSLFSMNNQLLLTLNHLLNLISILLHYTTLSQSTTRNSLLKDVKGLFSIHQLMLVDRGRGHCIGGLG